ncbi:hypothetical protein Tco_0390970 [Tanacetum coccineum]
MHFRKMWWVRAVNTNAYMNDNVSKNVNGITGRGNSYMNVVKGQMQPRSGDSQAVPAVVLDDECFQTYCAGLMGGIMDVDDRRRCVSFRNAYAFLRSLDEDQKTLTLKDGGSNRARNGWLWGDSVCGGYSSWHSSNEGTMRLYAYGRWQKNDNVENLNDCNMEEANVIFSGNRSTMNSKDDGADSVRSRHFKKYEIPRTGGSILSLLDELVKVGQVMGYNMDGCNATISDYFVMVRGVWRLTGQDLLMIAVYAPHDFKDKQLLWDYLTYEIGKWKGEVVIIGFTKIVEDAWRECPRDESNAMINMMGKLKYLKTKIREWNKTNMLCVKNVKAKYKVDLEDVEAIIDNGNGNEEVVNKRAEIVNNLQSIDKLHSLETTQKVKVKWSVEGDENSRWKLGILYLFSKGFVNLDPRRGSLFSMKYRSVHHRNKGGDFRFLPSILGSIESDVWVALCLGLQRGLEVVRTGLRYVSSKWKMKTLSIGWLMFKWVWRFYTQDSSLWARVIKAIHGMTVKSDSLPTRFNISRRGIYIDSIMYAICDKGAETSSHFFFSCCMVRQAVRLITCWWDVPYIEFESYDGWLAWLVNLRLPYKNKMMLEGVFYVMWWHLWTFRNKTIFEAKAPAKALFFDDVVCAGAGFLG